MDCCRRMSTRSTALGEMTMPIHADPQVLSGHASGGAAAERVQHYVARSSWIATSWRQDQVLNLNS